MSNVIHEERKKSLNNRHSDIIEARVVANYGDPGLDEDYHFDVLSRFVLVMIESWQRIPTMQHYPKMIVPVMRPQSLWINVEGGLTGNQTSQRRSDPMGNISIGAAGAFSVAGIPRINRPYTLGEVIKIKKMTAPLLPSSLGTSAFTTIAPNYYYGDWHTQGTSSAYFQNSAEAMTSVKSKCIYQDNSANFSFALVRAHYEAFMLHMSAGNTTLSNALTTGLFGVINSTDVIFEVYGGYFLAGVDLNGGVIFGATAYEDTNEDGKQRVISNACIPLVVTTPNSFPTPKSRIIGSISYTPTYSPIIQQ